MMAADPHAALLYSDEQTQLYCTEWEEVIDRLPVVDAIITDPPYGMRTLAGYLTSRKDGGSSAPHTGAEYVGWCDSDVHHFVTTCGPKNRGWWFVMTSHDLIPAWELAYARLGLYHFAPIPIVFPDSPRFAADGPCSSAVYAMVARPRSKEWATWRSLPGSYRTTERGSGSGRGKPYSLMLEIVNDYSREGALILDPFAGRGSTGRAAKDLRRSVILIERDAECAEQTKRTMTPRRAWQQQQTLGEPT